MNIEEAFPSKYLKAADLKGQSVSVRMDHVEMETVGDDNKVILYFQNKEKGLVLNVTNKNMIVDLYGPETQDWVGQPVILYEAMVQYQSKMVPAIRIKGQSHLSQRSLHPAKTAQHDPRGNVDMNDDIPFAPEFR